MKLKQIPNKLVMKTVIKTVMKIVMKSLMMILVMKARNPPTMMKIKMI